MSLEKLLHKTEILRLERALSVKREKDYPNPQFPPLHPRVKSQRVPKDNLPSPTSEGSQKKKHSGSKEQEILRWVTEEVGETPSLEFFKNRAAIWDGLDTASPKGGVWSGDGRSKAHLILDFLIISFSSFTRGKSLKRAGLSLFLFNQILHPILFSTAILLSP